MNMKQAQKMATVLVLASLVKSNPIRESLTEQLDAALTFMALGDSFSPSVDAILDVAGTEAMHVLCSQEGWKREVISQRVISELDAHGILGNLAAAAA